MIDFGSPDILLAEFERLSEWKARNRALLQELADTSSAGVLARAVAAGTLRLRDLAAGASPVDTGTLQSAHRGRVEGQGGDTVGIVYIDPFAVNPVNGSRPEFYGEIYATRYVNWFERVAEAHGESVLDEMEWNIAALFDAAWR